MAITTTIDVQFGDCDPAGIVYYPTLFHYCHVAFERAWGDSLGMPYSRLIERERLGYPTVHVETDFLSPARYGDCVTFRVWISKVGTSSVVFEFEASVANRIVLRSTHTKVCTNLDTLTKVEIPDAQRKRMAALTR